MRIGEPCAVFGLCCGWCVCCRLVLLQPRFYQPKTSDPNEPSGLFGPAHTVELYTELLQSLMRA